jgi:hypothetical protein
MIMTLDDESIRSSTEVQTALCPSESAGKNQAVRTIFLEDGKIVAAAPLAAKEALRALTDEWGLQISGMSGQQLVDHARALDRAIQTVYSTLSESQTRPLHLMHLLLLRQDRFFIAHLGASDAYLIRDRKVHPLALAPSLRKLEEALGFDFDAAGKLEPERISCGNFSWPELPAVHLVSAGYRSGDYLLFTSPGLFEQRDWPGILGSIARSGTPFDQAAVRLSRLGTARLRGGADGYLLVRIDGGTVPASVQEAETSADESRPSMAALAPMRTDDLPQRHLSHQLEIPSFGGPQSSGVPVGGGLAVLGLLVLGLMLFVPYFRESGQPGADAPSPPRTPCSGARR